MNCELVISKGNGIGYYIIRNEIEYVLLITTSYKAMIVVLRLVIISVWYIVSNKLIQVECKLVFDVLSS